MSNRRTTIKSAAGQKPPRLYLLVIYGALILLGLAILVIGQSSIGGCSRGPSTRPTQKNSKTREAAHDTSDRRPAATANQPVDAVSLVDDDGKTLWASPTEGRPLNLAYLPPGAQIVVALRPQKILRHPEGEKVIQALGPMVERAIDSLQEIAKVPLSEMERLLVCWQPTSRGNWDANFVITFRESQPIERLSQLQGATAKTHDEQDYIELDNRAYYLPKAENTKILVVSPASAISEIIELAGEAPPLRRNVEQLLVHTDADRALTLVVAPNALFSEGRSMFDGELTGLRQPLFWFLGDELSAAALSLDWSDNFYFELMAVPTLDTSPESASRILAQRVAEIPEKLESFVIGMNPRTYGRAVIARFPAMFRKLSAYTRSGFDGDVAVLNGYLPAVAGHNLLLGAELTLAEQSGGLKTNAEAAAPSAAEMKPPATITEKLQRVTSLQFPRDTLESALEQLSQDIDVPIVIRGADLQADGITKNQSFGIKVENKRADEILVEVLRLANPDKTAAGPNDTKQKLIYVIGLGEGGAEQVFVTTRAAAGARGEELPPVFGTADP